MLKIIKNNSIDWELLMKVLSGELSEDCPEFLTWLEEDEDHWLLYESLKEEHNDDARLFDPEKAYNKIRTQLFGKKKNTMPHILHGWIKYAVVVAVILTIGSWFIIRSFRITPGTVTDISENIVKNKIQPGGKKARLLLPDGSSVELQREFNVREKDGTVIQNDTTGRIQFLENKKNTGRPEYHTIEIPIGGEYELNLSDGTKIYLNSGSSLRFPSFFEKAERRVELTGEAYFEVTKNNVPFIVQMKDAEIKVLGTSFNVSAYSEYAAINATLVTGSIRMYAGGQSNSYTLSPGQNLNYNKESNDVSIKNVDTEMYTAWVRGKFIFRDQSLEEILNRLSKWYNFSIEYENADIKRLRFTGSAEKGRPLSYLLNQIETVTNIKFKKYEDRIVAYK